MSQTASLFQLQQLDLEIDARRQRVAAIVEEMGISTDLDNAKAKDQAAQDLYSQISTRMRDQELELSSVQNRIKQSEDRLYGGKIRNPKELEDLQSEAASLRRRQSDLEDELLDSMLAYESASQQVEEASSQLELSEAQQISANANSAAELQLQNDQLLSLDEKRQKLAQSIPRKDLADYDYLHPRCAGLPVAKLLGSSCDSCHTQQPSAKAQQARRGDIIHCVTCRRILHPTSK